MAANSRSAQILRMIRTLQDYGIKCDNNSILCDDTNIIDILKNYVLHSRTKHIEVRHHFLRDNVAKRLITLVLNFFRLRISYMTFLQILLREKRFFVN